MMCKLGVSGSFAVLRDTERLHWGYQQRTGDQCVVGVPLAMAPERGELMGYYVQRRENSNVVYTITDKPLTAEEWSGSQLQQQRRNSLSSVGGRITKPSHGNQALRYHLGLINPFGIDRATLLPHRALPDAIVTAAIFFELAKHAKWPQLVQWSYEPALMTYLRFGMHRGERFDAVPEDYLRWIAEGNHDLSEDARFSARYWLAPDREAPSDTAR